ncbi:MAG: hypothetical protein QXG98_05065 [Candidatus Micrarchaeia archaeon]
MADQKLAQKTSLEQKILAAEEANREFWRVLEQEKKAFGDIRKNPLAMARVLNASTKFEKALKEVRAEAAHLPPSLKERLSKLESDWKQVASLEAGWGVRRDKMGRVEKFGRQYAILRAFEGLSEKEALLLKLTLFYTDEMLATLSDPKEDRQAKETLALFLYALERDTQRLIDNGSLKETEIPPEIRAKIAAYRNTREYRELFEKTGGGVAMPIPSLPAGARALEALSNIFKIFFSSSIDAYAEYWQHPTSENLKRWLWRFALDVGVVTYAAYTLQGVSTGLWPMLRSIFSKRSLKVVPTKAIKLGAELGLAYVFFPEMERAVKTFLEWEKTSGEAKARAANDLLKAIIVFKTGEKLTAQLFEKLYPALRAGFLQYALAREAVKEPGLTARILSKAARGVEKFVLFMGSMVFFTEYLNLTTSEAEERAKDLLFILGREPNRANIEWALETLALAEKLAKELPVGAPQEMAREYLVRQNKPVTPENLNEAMKILEAVGAIFLPFEDEARKLVSLQGKEESEENIKQAQEILGLFRILPYGTRDEMARELLRLQGKQPSPENVEEAKRNLRLAEQVSRSELAQELLDEQGKEATPDNLKRAFEIVGWIEVIAAADLSRSKGEFTEGELLDRARSLLSLAMDVLASLESRNAVSFSEFIDAMTTVLVAEQKERE